MYERSLVTIGGQAVAALGTILHWIAAPEFVKVLPSSSPNTLLAVDNWVMVVGLAASALAGVIALVAVEIGLVPPRTSI
ncbi:hypothetical protein [Amycolatopsis sp. cmx-11-12]|uniref:hypothetical protein n=1 Tax=Amycolatopsis sp. cmx-11-12 TaxID=2785795 RepID=UPI003917F3E7